MYQSTNECFLVGIESMSELLSTLKDLKKHTFGLKMMTYNMHTIGC